MNANFVVTVNNSGTCNGLFWYYVSLSKSLCLVILRYFAVSATWYCSNIVSINRSKCRDLAAITVIHLAPSIIYYCSYSSRNAFGLKIISFRNWCNTSRDRQWDKIQLTRPDFNPFLHKIILITNFDVNMAVSSCSYWVLLLVGVRGLINPYAPTGTIKRIKKRRLMGQGQKKYLSTNNGTVWWYHGKERRLAMYLPSLIYFWHS